MQRLLITGAAGRLGRQLRVALADQARCLRLSDIADLGAAAPCEELAPCDLADAQAVADLVRGCDAIVHFGGIPNEQSFGALLASNIQGTVHVYEAARRHGVRRVVYASSNHTVGCHPQGARLETDCARRPDSLYGLTKCFGEDVARYYFDRHGIESACLRIGSAVPEPVDRRMLHTWISPRDLAQLVRCCLQAPVLGCTVVWGVSANRQAWWSNAQAAHLGYVPQDDAEAYRAALERTEPLAPDDPAARYQGGAFVRLQPLPLYDAP
ncbi:MAG: NAD(P)-dependent oxidoreductase [Rhodoferax sp.]|nr:NAD(P)-dependent oxidoreductase [Rhodoferax sp.]